MDGRRAASGKKAAGEEVVTSRPYGGVQKVRAKRTAFDARRRKAFLEHLAATCNVKGSAAAAGVTVQCVYQRRMRDAAFRGQWGAALEQGYARLEMEMLAHALVQEAVEIDGDLIVADQPFDPDMARFLLREHKKGLGGASRSGAPAQPADWQQVEDYFVDRLRALANRTAQ